MDEPKALYLRLSESFGGVRFGPFEGVAVSLGTAEDNDIQVPEGFGASPHHVQVLRQEGMGLILTPVERSSAVFLFRQGRDQPQQVVTPTALRPGDGFALVTPQGPRFTVEIDDLPPEILAARHKARLKRRLSADAFKDEARRQAFVAVLTTGIGQAAQRAWTAIRSGQIFRPRNVLMMIGVLGGYVAAAVQWVGKSEAEAEVVARTEEVEDCRAELELAGGRSSVADATFTQLARDVTGVGALLVALNDDPTLGEAVRARARQMTGASSRWAWLVDPARATARTRAFAAYRAALTDTDLDPEVARLLTWAAAVSGVDAGGWRVLEDSRGELVCGRGPLGLTWRQARALGLEATIDAALTGSTREFRGEASAAARLERLRREARAGIVDDAKLDEELERLQGDVTTDLHVSDDGATACLFVDGPDDRTEPRRIAAALARVLGPERRFLPDPDLAEGVIDRVAALYAADLPGADLTRRDGGVLEVVRGLPGEWTADPRLVGGSWVLERSAEALAAAIVLPCTAVLSAEDPASLVDTLGESLPNAVQCLVLDWKLTH